MIAGGPTTGTATDHKNGDPESLCEWRSGLSSWTPSDPTSITLWIGNTCSWANPFTFSIFALFT